MKPPSLRCVGGWAAAGRRAGQGPRRWCLRQSQVDELRELVQAPGCKVELVFILDGYDELPAVTQFKNLWRTNNLEQFRASAPPAAAAAAAAAVEGGRAGRGQGRGAASGAAPPPAQGHDHLPLRAAVDQQQVRQLVPAPGGPKRGQGRGPQSGRVLPGAAPRALHGQGGDLSAAVRGDPMAQPLRHGLPRAAQAPTPPPGRRTRHRRPPRTLPRPCRRPPCRPRRQPKLSCSSLRRSLPSGFNSSSWRPPS